MNTRKNIQMAALLVAAATIMTALTASAAPPPRIFVPTRRTSVVVVKKVLPPPPVTSWESVLIDVDECDPDGVWVLRTWPKPPLPHPHGPVVHHWTSSSIFHRHVLPAPALPRTHFRSVRVVRH
ncbi:MAG: hypothetical protein BWX88_02509 [Planctomycetes bacterium ADurb.Bin126]|nr:MAG: hypothetical protein BWX88_02509 [Planctomycetes bacterium ADurb.Bin126]HOD82152.1 hypothetical protein [Phycisphaerae bacterium]HQL72625.1 hypothetical protein [Phycisphaerae bacterium]